MVLYGLSLSILEEKIQIEYPVFPQSYYSDDFITAGAGAHLKPPIARIKALGTACGLFLEPDKSQFLQVPGVS